MPQQKRRALHRAQFQKRLLHVPAQLRAQLIDTPDATIPEHTRRFNADRMVMDYTLKCYVPAAGGIDPCTVCGGREPAGRGLGRGQGEQW